MEGSGDQRLHHEKGQPVLWKVLSWDRLWKHGSGSITDWEKAETALEKKKKET